MSERIKHDMPNQSKTAMIIIDRNEVIINHNHMYHVLSVFLDYNRVYSTYDTWFTIEQIFDFMDIKYDTRYAAYKHLMAAFQEMQDKNKISLLKPLDQKSIKFNTHIGILINEKEFYATTNGYFKIERSDIVKIAGIKNKDISKDKLLHIYLYIKSFKICWASIETISSATGISKNTVSKILSVLSDENLISMKGSIKNV